MVDTHGGMLSVGLVVSIPTIHSPREPIIYSITSVPPTVISTVKAISVVKLILTLMLKLVVKKLTKAIMRIKNLSNILTIQLKEKIFKEIKF